jgi:hypothetical protein
MRREKVVVLFEEFPFLQAIAEATKWDWKSGQITVARMDAAFLSDVPVRESYESSAGSDSREERLFAVRNGQVAEITLIPSLDHSTGYAYDKATRTEGQTFLSVLVEEEPFDFLVRYEYAYCSYQDGSDKDLITILKPSKHSSISEEWEKALATARQELFKDADV